MNAKPNKPESYPRERITAGILAGGRATRMGGIDKGLVELNGRAMVDYVIAGLRPQVGSLIINANRNFRAYERYGLPVVPDLEEGFLGPLAGMASMMRAASTPWLLTSPCDSPQVSAELGPRMWQALQQERGEIGVAWSKGRLQPVFALLSCALLDSLLAYLQSGERKIDRWYGQHAMVSVDFSDCPDMFVNVNTLEERDELARKLGAAQERQP